MKAKKAVKRLNKVEALLNNVIDQFPGAEQQFGELLDRAKAAVIRARETVNAQLATRPAKKAPASAEITEQPLATENSTQAAPAAANRRAGTKRKGMNTPAARRLKKTA